MFKNIIANYLGRFWSIVSNYLFIPLYIKYLGFESYSIISFTLVIAGLMVMFDSGLTATLSRELARSDNTLSEKIRLFKTLESLYLIIAVVCIIIIFSLSDIISEKWLNLDQYAPEKVSFFLKIISFEIGFQLLLRFYSGGLLGLEKQITVNIYHVGWGIIRNGIIVIMLIIAPSLEVFFYWQTIATVLFTFLVRYSLFKSLSGKREFLFKFKIEKSVIRRNWEFTSGMLLISVIASLNSQMDKLAISKLLSVDNLGYYTLAVSLSMGILMLVNPISVAVLPRFTALYTAHKDARASEMFLNINMFVCILVSSVLSVMIFFPKDLIWIWTGNHELAEHSFIYLPIISFSVSMLSLATIPYNIAIANGYTRLNNIMGIISLFVTLPGYWIVTRIYGALGAAMVYCLVQTVITMIYYYLINKKFLKARISQLFIKQIFFPFLISICISYGFSLLPEWFADHRSQLLIWIMFCTAINFAFTSILLIPTKKLKTLIKSRRFD